MNNLVPEQRVDKSGQTNLKWVRPQGATSGNAASIPAPAMGGAPALSPEKTRAEVEKILAPIAAEFGDDHTKFYAKASAKTIGYIHKALTDKSMPEVLKSQLSCMMNDNVEESVMDAYTAIYDFHQNGVENMGAFDDMGEVDFLRGAIESGAVSSLGFDRENEDRVREVTDLFNFLANTDIEKYTFRKEIKGITTQGMPACSYQIKNGAIAEFIMDYPEKLQQVIDAANDDAAGNFDFSNYKELSDRFGVEYKPAEGRNAQIRAIAGLVRSAVAQYGDDHDRFFKRASDETIDCVYRALEQGDRKYIAAEVSHLMNNKSDTEDDVMKVFVTLYDEHKKFQYDDLGEVAALRGALNSGTNAKRTFDPSNPEDVRDTLNAFKFISEGDRDGHFTDYRNEVVELAAPVADFIRENPEQADALISLSQARPDLLVGRDKGGIGVMVRDFEKSSKALIDGAL